MPQHLFLLAYVIIRNLFYGNLNNNPQIKDIKQVIKTYLEQNDNIEVPLTILCDAEKAE